MSDISRMAAQPVTFDAVVCRYGRSIAVSSVDLSVSPGEHLAVMGANGSGKSTLLRAVLGLHPLASGNIKVGDESAASVPGQLSLRRKVAWVPQRLTPGRFPLMVQELLGSAIDGDAAHESASRLGVAGLHQRPLSTLSGGQLQRVFLARALGCVAGGAGVLLADEPTAALDFAGQEQVAKLLAALPVTVIVVSHDRAMSRTCDRVAEMAAGRMRII